MKIDMTIYNEQADVDSLTECALQLCKVVIANKKDRLRQNETNRDKLRQGEII